MANAGEKGWKVDITTVIGDWVCSHPMENAVCFTYMLRFLKYRNSGGE
jgi:hypothetical protein